MNEDTFLATILMMGWKQNTFYKGEWQDKNRTYTVRLCTSVNMVKLVNSDIYSVMPYDKALKYILK